MNFEADKQPTLTTRRYAGTAEQNRGQRRSRAKVPADRKRAVYVLQACQACKRRKTRCDGAMPCEPCKRRSIDCEFTTLGSELNALSHEQTSTLLEGPNSAGSEQIGLAELTELVSTLQRKVASLENKPIEMAKPSTTKQNSDSYGQECEVSEDDMQSSVQASSPYFAGPTSANFSFSIARMILEQADGQNMGPPTNGPDLAGSTSDENEECDEDPTVFNHFTGALTSACAPLPENLFSDALRLIKVYQECVGTLHPILSIDMLQKMVRTRWKSPSGLTMESFDEYFPDADPSHLKMVLAIALLSEGGGSSSMAGKIYGSLQPVIANAMMARSFSLRGQRLLILTAFYHTFQDDHRMASRYIAIASRLLIESGLHQRPILLQRFPETLERRTALIAIATCIFLDRQVNFNAGLPFTLREADTDIPELDLLPPYLKAVSSYARIGPSAWTSVIDERGTLKSRLKDEDFDFMDFQVRRWYETLPRELCYSKEPTHNVTTDGWTEMSPSKGTQFMRYLLYLRANQFKIVILRPLLFHFRFVLAHVKRVRQLGELACDNINVILEMNEKHDLYRKQQPFLNIFLSSALSALFLVYVHSLRFPGSRSGIRSEMCNYGAAAREGIDKGLGLVRMYLASSSARRLWKKFARPRGFLDRLGISPLENENEGAARQTTLSHQPPHLRNSNAAPLLNDSSTSWDYLANSVYATADGPEHLLAAQFQFPSGFSGFPATPFFELDPMLTSGNYAGMYDDVWWTATESAGS